MAEKTMKYLNDKKKKSLVNAVFFLFTILVTAVAILTGSYLHDIENITVNSIAGRRYVANKDMVDIAATNKLRQEAASTIGPLYKHDDTVQGIAIENIKVFFEDLGEMVDSASYDAEGRLSFKKK